MNHTTQTATRVIDLNAAHPIDWPELALSLIRHVEQAAHESGPCPANRPSTRDIRLELPSNWPITAALKTRIQHLFDVVHQRLAQEFSVRALKVVTHRSLQTPRLVLTGFDTQMSSKTHVPKPSSYI